MRYYVSNFKEDFSRQVIDRFIHAYEVGATPNPCIDCNRFMKFARLYHRAKEQDCDTIVTGHYARIDYDEEEGRYLLKKSANAGCGLFHSGTNILSNELVLIGVLEKQELSCWLYQFPFSLYRFLFSTNCGQYRLAFRGVEHCCLRTEVPGNGAYGQPASFDPYRSK